MKTKLGSPSIDPVELRRLATIARLKRREKKKPKPLRAHDLKGEMGILPRHLPATSSTRSA